MIILLAVLRHVIDFLAFLPGILEVRVSAFDAEGVKIRQGFIRIQKAHEIDTGFGLLLGAGSGDAVAAAQRGGGVGIPFGRRLHHHLLAVAGVRFNIDGGVGPPGNRPVLRLRGIVVGHAVRFILGDIAFLSPAAHQLAVILVFLGLNGVDHFALLPVHRNKVAAGIAGEEVKPVHHEAVEHGGSLQQQGIFQIVRGGFRQHGLQILQLLNGGHIPAVFVHQLLAEHEVVPFHVVLVDGDEIIPAVILRRFPLAFLHGGIQRRTGKQIRNIVHRVLRNQIVAPDGLEPGGGPQQIHLFILQRHPGLFRIFPGLDIAQADLHVDLVGDIIIDRLLDLLHLLGVGGRDIEGATIHVDHNLVVRAGKGHDAQNQSKSQYQRNKFLHRDRILLIKIYFITIRCRTA